MALKPYKQQQSGGLFSSPLMKAYSAYSSYGTSEIGNDRSTKTSYPTKDQSQGGAPQKSSQSQAMPPQQQSALPKQQYGMNDALQNRYGALQNQSLGNQDQFIQSAFQSLYDPSVPQQVRAQAEPIFQSYYQRRYGGMA